MARCFRALFLAIALCAWVPAFGGAKWTQPTPEELKMTSDPEAPGAAAVYLYLEQTADDTRHERTYYARIKVLTEDGRAYGDVTMPFWKRQETIRSIEGRTIHTDGTVIPFTGKPWQKELVKSGGVRIMEKGFSLPDVQVGSILEYRYRTVYSDWWPPKWYLQQGVFVHEAHYHFMPGGGSNVFATRFLPQNAQINEKHGWDLHVTNIPPQVEEDDSPPLHSLGYRVLFYYLGPNLTSPGQYWASQGGGWSFGVDEFAAADKLKSVVAQIVAPGDSDEQKVEKIYAEVMKLENTTFTREHTAQEDNARNVRESNAADVWTQQRGNRQQITLLFLGLVRAAGLTAYAMQVTSRDENVFMPKEADWDQLDDLIAIVNVDGEEQFFDPGERYCEFGKLHWKHTWTGGVRQTAHSVELGATPFPAYQDTAVTRSADLAMDAEGQVRGSIRIEMTGNMALRWRQEALLTDEEQAKKEFGDELQAEMPAGTTVKMQGFTALQDYTHPLVATLAVSGTMGTKTGKRLFLPGTFFEAQAKPRFATATRVNPVYLPYTYVVRDDVKMKLPPNASAEIVPTNAEIPYAEHADFSANYRVAGNIYQCSRMELVSKVLYPTKDYPDLRDFFQKMNAQDQAQLVLKMAPATATASVGKKE